MPKTKKKNEKKYFVYRFLDSDGTIIYVGRTVNLPRRLAHHDHKTDDVARVEYIECITEADMIWKEIYYINLFYNSKSLNEKDVYDGVTDIHLDDKWKVYTNSKECFRDYSFVFDNLKKSPCAEYVKDPPQYNYRKLIHVLDNKRMNGIGEEKTGLSRAWYMANTDDCFEGLINTLRKHTNNYLRNVSKKCIDNPKNKIVWTTFPEFRPITKGKGYANDYVDPFYFSSSEIKDKYVVAYLCNHFLPVKESLEGKYTDDEYAIFLLVAFLFSTTVLKYGEEIWIYLPSKRMRGLLKQWIKENSVQESEAEFEECAS